MRTLAFLGTVAILFVAGCGSGGGGGQCGVAGQACVGNSCCAGLQCTNNGTGNVCSSNQCAASGQSCATVACCNGLTCQGGTCASNQCAQSGQSCATVACCNGLTCMAGTCQQMQQCAGNGQSCASLSCCNGLTCMNGSCVIPSGKKGFGQAPCATNTDCSTNLCAGFTGLSTQDFCSAGCNNSATCAQLGGNYWCVTGQMGGICLRGCTSSNDCADLGSDWSCDITTNAENMYDPMCGVWKNLAEGQVCLQNNQCAKGVCNGAWCSGPCFSTADCTGSNPNTACLLTQGAAQACFPTCTSNNDCTIYNMFTGLNTTCKAATDVGNVAVMVCSG